MDRVVLPSSLASFPMSVFGLKQADFPPSLHTWVHAWVQGLSPFYQENGITIFRGDCRQILPRIPASFFDLLLSDPPYGINLDTNVHGKKGPRRRKYRRVRGDDRVFDPSHLLAYERIVLWGANYYASSLPRSTKWIIWDKRQGRGQNCQSDCEIAWTRGLPGVATRAFYHYWNGAIRASEMGEVRLHPTQKPVSLMRWCVSLFPGVQTIIDPYMGVGTTLVAAKQLGLNAIGIELDADYCRLAAKRVEQTTRLLN